MFVFNVFGVVLSLVVANDEIVAGVVAGVTFKLKKKVERINHKIN